jgi:DnaK suppressor protein
MSRSHADLDREFIDEQRRRLETLREQARSTRAGAGREEQQLQREWDEPQDLADRSSHRSGRDLEDTVERVEAYRQDEIERALAKIDEGTYGLSDVSGGPIPRERLQAKPEAIRTVEEEEAAEAAARGSGRGG